MLCRFIIISFLFVLGAGSSFGKDGSKSSSESTILMRAGAEALEKKDYSLAIKKLTRAEEYAAKERDFGVLWRVKNYLGQSYNGIGLNSRALKELAITLNILSKRPELEKYKTVVFNNLGSIYIEEKDYKRALHYLKSGIAIFKEHPEHQDLQHVKYFLTLNIADLYTKSQNYEAALKTLNNIETRDLASFPEVKQLANLISAKALFFSGRTEEAKRIASEVLINAPRTEQYYEDNLDILSKIYYSEKNFDKALYFQEQIINNTKDWRRKADSYEAISNIYREKKEPAMQLKYKDSVIAGKDSMVAMTNKELLQNSRILLDIENYKNKLAINQEIQKRQQELFWTVSIGLGLLLGSIFLWQKNRLARQRQEKLVIQNKEQLARLRLEEQRKDLQLIQNQLKNQEEIALIKHERLKEELDQKNRLLATKALFITERNSLIKEVIAKVSGITEVSDDNRIRKLIESLQNELKIGNEWGDYVQLFEEINPNFFRYLNEKHPTLSTSDLRFLSYLYMNLTLQEIATVMVITLEACKKRKQRIARKMGVNTSDVLDYLLKIEI